MTKQHGKVKIGLFIIAAIVFLILLSLLFLQKKYSQQRWAMNWDNVPEDIRQNNRGKVTRLVLAPNGDIWGGSDTGVIHIKGQTWETYATESLQNIRDIEVGPDGQVWALTNNNSFQRFDGESWHTETSFNGLMDIAITSNGDLWGATLKGLYQYDGKTWQASTLDITEQDKNHGLCAITADADGSLWAGGCSVDFIIFHIDGEKVTCFSPENTDGIIENMRLGSNGDLWLYSMGMKTGVNSMGYFNGAEWKIYDYERLNRLGTRLEAVYDLHSDSQGIAWVATPTGLCRFNGWFCKTYLKGESIYAVTVTDDDSIWLGLENAVVKMSQ